MLPKPSRFFASSDTPSFGTMTWLAGMYQGFQASVLNFRRSGANSQWAIGRRATHDATLAPTSAALIKKFGQLTENCERFAARFASAPEPRRHEAEEPAPLPHKDQLPVNQRLWAPRQRHSGRQRGFAHAFGMNPLSRRSRNQIGGRLSAVRRIAPCAADSRRLPADGMETLRTPARQGQDCNAKGLDTGNPNSGSRMTTPRRKPLLCPDVDGRLTSR